MLLSKRLLQNLQSLFMFKNVCNVPGYQGIFYNVYYKNVKNMNIGFVKLGNVKGVISTIGTYRKKDMYVIENEAGTDEGAKRKNKIARAVKIFKIILTQLTKNENYIYRIEKDREWAKNELIVSIDMQNVVMLPRMSGVKKFVFFKRIVVYNETFAPFGGSTKGKGDTGTRHGRAAEDVASTYLKFIRTNRDTNILVSGPTIAQHRIKTDSFLPIW